MSNKSTAIGHTVPRALPPGPASPKLLPFVIGGDPAADITCSVCARPYPYQFMRTPVALVFTMGDAMDLYATGLPSRLYTDAESWVIDSAAIANDWEEVGNDLGVALNQIVALRQLAGRRNRK